MPTIIVGFLLTGSFFGSAYVPHILGVVLFFVIYMIWILTICSVIHDVNNPKPSLLFKLFVFNIFYSILYIFFDSMFNEWFIFSDKAISSFLGLYYVFSIIYCILFVSRELVMAEGEPNPPFNRYLGSMLLIFIFPIGVWFIQSRVRKVLVN